MSWKEKKIVWTFFPIFRQSLRILAFLLADASILFSSFRYIPFEIDEFEEEDLDGFRLFLEEWSA